MGTVILNVAIVLGIIIAGGFLIFFLGDLLMSIVNPRGEEESVRLKRKESAKKFAKKVEALPVEQQEELKEEAPIAGAVIEAAFADENAEKPAEEEKPVIEEYKAEEEDTDEQSEEEKLAEARAALERRKAEILKRMQEQIENDESEQEDEEPAEEVEEVEEEVEETVEVDEEKEQIRAELEQAKKALEAERARYETLATQINNHEATTVVTGSREDYEAQKAELEARLRDNEKELKACKKEYIPLAKVSKTLANDEKKLRRKEAIVAKQQVMLYGVNNYEDIDEEKAKKLAEELDLYDGLKLSVQHCHEVMDANKDRFPILEKMYYILKTQNEHIKADLLEVNNILETFDDNSEEGSEE